MKKIPLLLLHGALGSSEQLKDLQAALTQQYEVHVLDFSGHGKAEKDAEDFTIAGFANDVLGYMQARNIDTINLIGYSMGGYVAMYLALKHPDKVQQLACMATKWAWNPESSKKEVQFLNSTLIEEKLPKYAAQLKERHARYDWKKVLYKTAAMMLAMGEAPPLAPDAIATVAQKVLLILGDKDAMVSREETFAIYQQLKNANLAILPHCKHPIEQYDVQLLQYLISDFLKE